MAKGVSWFAGPLVVETNLSRLSLFILFFLLSHSGCIGDSGIDLSLPCLDLAFGQAGLSPVRWWA